MAVGEIDPPRDAVKIGFGDDLYEFVNAPLRVDVLDVGLVLAERFNNVVLDNHGVTVLYCVLYKGIQSYDYCLQNPDH